MEPNLDDLKAKLLTMASHSEAAVHQAVKALLRRDDDLARRTKDDDALIDALEMEIDDLALKGLAAAPMKEADLRAWTTAMKIAHDLERVGDEATSIARRVLELSLEPRLHLVESIPPIARQATEMLKLALDAFVQRDSARARQVIPKDDIVDDMNKALGAESVRYMAEHPESVPQCLNLMVISKCLERIADHATNVAEMVVYLCEGRDIRHGHETDSFEARA